MRLCLASAFIVLIATPVLADPRPMQPTAKAELDRGLERFAAHDYVTAIAAFDAGYAIDPHPDFLYAKAQAQRLGGDCRSAIDTYTAFLASAPPASESELAKGNIAKCQQLLAASHPVEPAVEPSQPVAPPLAKAP